MTTTVTYHGHRAKVLDHVHGRELKPGHVFRAGDELAVVTKTRPGYRVDPYTLDDFDVIEIEASTYGRRDHRFFAVTPAALVPIYAVLEEGRVRL